jgi:hypothetical protein
VSIDTISPEQFTIDELEPLQSYFPSDAIDYFTIDPAKKKLYLEQAIAEGSLSGQVFSDCNSFSTIEHKHNRCELKRAQEILKMLWEVSKHAGKDDIGSKISLALAQDSVTMAALIEACAKLRNETGATAELKDFYLGCLDEAQAELYTPPKKEVANRILAMLRVKVENLEENALTHNARETISAFKSDYPFSFIDRGAEPFCSPMSDERVSEFSAEMHRRYDITFKQLKEEYGDLTNDLIPEVTNRYLELRGIRTQNFENGEISGWNCQYDERVGGFKNQPKLSTLLCGKFAVSISWQRFEELMMHEVEGHVIRAYNPKSRGHEALAYGLPRNEDAEEG